MQCCLKIHCRNSTSSLSGTQIVGYFQRKWKYCSTHECGKFYQEVLPNSIFGYWIWHIESSSKHRTYTEVPIPNTLYTRMTIQYQNENSRLLSNNVTAEDIFANPRTVHFWMNIGYTVPERMIHVWKLRRGFCIYDENWSIASTLIIRKCTCKHPYH